MNRRKRLAKRFKAHDDQVSRWVGLGAIGVLFYIFLVSWLLSNLEMPGWLKALLSIAIVAVSIMAAIVIAVLAPYFFGAKHDLLCSKCGQPLRKYASKFVRDAPDRPMDGSVPKRCPSCRAEL